MEVFGRAADLAASRLVVITFAARSLFASIIGSFRSSPLILIRALSSNMILVRSLQRELN
jgi:hypothetical protein